MKTLVPHRVAWVLAVVLYYLGCASPSAHSEPITLTDSQGRKLTGEVSEVRNDDFTVTVDGKEQIFELAMLAAVSRAELLVHAKRAGIYKGFPPVTVEVQVAMRRRNDEAAWYRKNADIVSKFMLYAMAPMDEVPPTRAKIIIVTQDTREKWVNRKEKYFVEHAETADVEQLAKSERKEVRFATVEVSYDTDKDYTNVGGAMYKYFVFGLIDPATDRLIHFETNCEELKQHLRKFPDKRMDFLNMGKGTVFPTKF